MITNFQPTLHLQWRTVSGNGKYRLKCLNMEINREHFCCLFQLWICSLTGKEEWRQVEFKEDYDSSGDADE